MKIASLFLSALLVLATPLQAQSLPGDSAYHLQASTQDANGAPVAWASLRGSRQSTRWTPTWEAFRATAWRTFAARSSTR